MTKNGIIGLSAGAIVVLGGLTLYTHSAFSSQITQSIAQNDSTQYSLSIESQDHGLISSSVEYKLSINKNVAAQFGTTLPKNIDFYFTHAYSSYPLVVNSDFKLDFTKGVAKEFMTMMTVDQIEHFATLSTNLLTQSNALNVEIKPTALEDKTGSVVNLGNLNYHFDGNLDFSFGDFTFNLDNLIGEMTDGGKMSMSELTASGNIASEKGFVYTQKQEISLKSFNISNEAVLENWAITNLKLSGGADGFSSDAINSDLVIMLDRLVMKNSLLDYTVTDTKLDFSIANIDKDSFIEVNKVSRNGGQPKQLLTAAEGILARGFNGTITKVKTTINDVKIDSQGKFDVPAYDGEMHDKLIMMHMMQKFSLDYNANLSNNYASVFPQYAPMIDGMAAQGFATKDEKGNVSTVIKIKDMAITANDKRIR